MSDEKLRETFSNNLKYWLEKRDKTQADLCRFMGVSSATASDWCNYKKIPRIDKIGKICAWLGIELDDLLADPKATVWEYPEGHIHIRSTGESSLSKEERVVIQSVRNADDLTRQMVYRLLGITTEEKKEGTA